jgi:ribosomal subunit interface protein
MQIQVHYQGLESSPWMDKFITGRVSKLNRYVNQSASLQINLKFENRKYSTSLAVHHLNRDFAFSGEGENLYESFASALDKALRSMSEHKRRIKDKINKRYIPLKQAVA